MKEATGELNATVIVVIVVAMLVAFFYFTIWPVLEQNMNANTRCSQAICASEPNSDGRSVECQIYEDGKPVGAPFSCAWKG